MVAGPGLTAGAVATACSRGHPDRAVDVVELARTATTSGCHLRPHDIVGLGRAEGSDPGREPVAPERWWPRLCPRC
ncbi:hypothetical protein [Streptomyces coeruleoprunus]|uniref:hypothetical protein n=1 Tax=Streptomyces coeruleoprunus TaxID=285563 RepID=UPI0031E6FB11